MTEVLNDQSDAQIRELAGRYVYADAQAAFVCLVALVVIGREFGMRA